MPSSKRRTFLPLALSVVGEDRFVYASDFPHESEATVQRALHGFLARQDVSDGAKRRILYDNVLALYRLQPSPVAAAA